MTLLFTDSFDHYTTLTEKWTASAGSSWNPNASGRFGNGIAVSFSNSGSQFATLSGRFGNQTTLVVGFAFYIGGTTAHWDQPWVQLREGATVHVDFRVNSSRQPYITRNGTTLGSVSSTVLPTNAWMYIELKVVVHDTTGSFELRKDGVNIASASSVDTRNAGSGFIDTMHLSCPNSGNGQVLRWDDLYFDDSDFLGDIRVYASPPNGNGNASQFVGSDANSTDNYLLVDEVPPSSSDYVESNTSGAKDTYAFTDLVTPTGTVLGVQIGVYAAKTDAGTRSIASVARHASTEEDSANRVLSTSYQYFFDVRPTKPGGGAWTISDVNAAEFGVKVA